MIRARESKGQLVKKTNFVSPRCTFQKLHRIMIDSFFYLININMYIRGSQHMKQYFESSDLSYTFFKSSTLSSDLQMLKFGS